MTAGSCRSPARAARPAHPGAVVDAAFSPDGGRSPRWAATASSGSGTRHGAPRRSDPRRRRTGSVHYSPTGRRLVLSGDDGVVRVIDVRSGIVVAEMRGHAGGIYGAVFAGGENEVISAGSDGTLRTWAVPRRPRSRSAGRGRLTR